MRRPSRIALGNCLSLVIMTSAFAKALDLPVTYQKVFIDETFARSGDMYLLIGHVNLTLGHRASPTSAAVGYRVGQKSRESDAMTIDFLPPGGHAATSGRGRSARTS